MPNPTREEVLTRLETLCTWKGLALKLSLQKLLRHVVLTALDGKPSDLKEQLIGIHVYDKFADWNPKEDATVRVAMGKLRREINSYYETDGVADPVRILLEPGVYAPEFTFRKGGTKAPLAPVEKVKPEPVVEVPKAESPVAPAPPIAPPPQVIIIREIRERVPPTPAPAPDPVFVYVPGVHFRVVKAVATGLVIDPSIQLYKWLRKKFDE